jgi:glycosyltransferase involved in cell wall biosynthesis
MKVSVVVPVYNEEGSLPELLPRLMAVHERRAAPL